MVELLFSIVILPVGALSFFTLGRVLGTRFSSTSTLLCGALLLLGSLSCWLAGGALQWALWTPSSIAYQMSYSPALLVVCAAGVLSVDSTVQARSRELLSSGLCLSVAALLCGALLRPYCRPPELSPQSLWSEGVCLQSHESSCVPAAASSLLHLHGLEFGEQALAVTALTSSDGTPPLGSFLAVSKATAGSDFKACIQLNRPSPESILHLPMLAHVQFDGVHGSKSNTRGLYSRFLNGIRARSEGHAVVIVQRCDDGWIVADPAAGRVIWSDQQLAESWNGEGVYLSPR